MTLKEAIENGQELLRTSSREKSPDSWDTLKILIEAGKAIHEWRIDYNDDSLIKLPGETEE